MDTSIENIIFSIWMFQYLLQQAAFAEIVLGICVLLITILLKNMFSPLGLCFVLVQSILSNHILICSYC